ncbi:MAG: HAD family hydrolase [Deltaproteobacteria bacterium]|nr:HAD family hydrolase [Deltaproteobacteria bacterium]
MNILLFDYDGVIVDSLEVFRDRVISTCKRYGSKNIISKEDFLTLFNGNFYEKLMESGIPKEKIPQMILDFQIGLDEQKNIRLFDGVKEMLEKLSRNNRLIIITSNVTRVIEESLKLKNMTCFEEILGADKETSKVKKIKMMKSKHKGCSIYYIGDTRGDILEGKKAGIKTIAITWGWHSQDQLGEEQPDFMVDSPQALVKLFENE